MKKLANLKGVKALSKNEQKLINGGGLFGCIASYEFCESHCDGICVSCGYGYGCQPYPKQ